MTPPFAFNDLLDQLTELRETHLPVYYIMKDMRKDTDEEITKGKV